MTCALLINEPPLQVLPSLAKAIGLNQALVLQQTHYWLHTHHAKVIDGCRWIDASAKDWQEKNFPFWSIDTVRRIIKDLETRNLLIAKPLAQKRFDQTKWYTIDYAALTRIATQLGNLPNSIYAACQTQHGQSAQLNTGRLPTSYKEETKEETKAENKDNNLVSGTPDAVSVDSISDDFEFFDPYPDPAVPAVAPAKHETSSLPTVPSATKPRRRQTPIATLPDAELPDWLDTATWVDFKAMRKLIRKPMTARAERLILKNLDQLREQGNDPVAVLEQSITHCWQDVYEIKSRSTLSPALRPARLVQDDFAHKDYLGAATPDDQLPPWMREALHG